jgi:transcriptional regulator with XRE-family HTH domain
MAVSDDPITIALKPLMLEAGVTFRSLSERTRAQDTAGRGVTHTYLCGLTSGREYPSTRSMELIAAALDIPPTYFAEYRLAQLQLELDGRRVGFRAAWQRYAELVG